MAKNHRSHTSLEWGGTENKNDDSPGEETSTCAGLLALLGGENGIAAGVERRKDPGTGKQNSETTGQKRLRVLIIKARGLAHHIKPEKPIWILGAGGTNSLERTFANGEDSIQKK